MIRKYNYHNWSKFMVDSFEKRPTGPHYAAILFETKQEWTPPYDKDDVGSSHSVNCLTYFCFTEEENLKTWVEEATVDNKQFIFYQVSQLGKAQINVSVKA